MQLFDAAVSFAREAGAKALYVSAAPTETPSTSTSIAAVFSRLSPTQRSWLPSPTTSTSSNCSEPPASLGEFVQRCYEKPRELAIPRQTLRGARQRYER